MASKVKRKSGFPTRGWEKTLTDNSAIVFSHCDPIRRIDDELGLTLYKQPEHGGYKYRVTFELLGIEKRGWWKKYLFKKKRSKP